MAKTNTASKTIRVSRKSILTAVTDTEVKALLLATMQVENDGLTEDILDEALNKWMTALTKTAKSTKGKDDEYIKETVVPWVLAQSEPVTASQLNKEVIGAPRANRASALLKRAVDLGLVARDKVRKNASFVYAAPDYDFEAYIEAYDQKVAAKAAARIEKARANRS